MNFGILLLNEQLFMLLVLKPSVSIIMSGNRLLQRCKWWDIYVSRGRNVVVQRKRFNVQVELAVASPLTIECCCECGRSSTMPLPSLTVLFYHDLPGPPRDAPYPHLPLMNLLPSPHSKWRQGEWRWGAYWSN